MLCTKCGTEIKETDRVCFKCGAVNKENNDMQDVLKSYGYGYNIDKKMNNGDTSNIVYSASNQSLLVLIISLIISSLLAWLVLVGTKDFAVYEAILTFAITLFFTYGYMMFYTKVTGKLWPVFVPLLNIYVFMASLFESAILICILMFIPGVNLIVSIMTLLKIAEKYDKSFLLLLFFGFVIIPCMGISSQY